MNNVCKRDRDTRVSIRGAKPPEIKVFLYLGGNSFRAATLRLHALHLGVQGLHGPQIPPGKASLSENHTPLIALTEA